MLFLESPVGVGFSYSNTTSDYDNLGDDFTENNAYAFLHNWFHKFPSYRTRTFFIAGESYAGKYVPELAGLIYDKNKDPSLFINLKGIFETHKTIREKCDFNSNDTWSNNDCSEAVDEVLRQYKEMDIYSLYTSVCIGNTAYADNKAVQVMFKKSGSKMMPRIMGGYDPCLDDYAKGYYNRPDVQKALHVSDGRRLKNWSICKRLQITALQYLLQYGDIQGLVRVKILFFPYKRNSLMPNLEYGSTVEILMEESPCCPQDTA